MCDLFSSLLICFALSKAWVLLAPSTVFFEEVVLLLISDLTLNQKLPRFLSGISVGLLVAR